MQNKLQPSSAFGSAAWRLTISGGFAGLVLALLVFAPARWLAALVESASDAHVLLVAPRGSFWLGSAQLVFAGGMGSRDAVALPGHLTWRIRPTWNGLSVQLSAECCTQEALQLHAVPVGWRGVRLALSDGQSQWPAGLLAGLGTPWNTVQAQGQLVASTQGFITHVIRGQLSMTGRLQIDAVNISSRLSTLHPMGSYRVTVLGGAPATLQLETLDGSLQLSGQGQWVGQRLHFDGTASAKPESVDALSNLLNIIGRRNGATSIIKVG